MNKNGQMIANICILTSNTDGMSTSGTIRLERTETSGWRKEADDANILLAVSVSNDLLFGTDSVVLEAAMQTVTNK